MEDTMQYHSLTPPFYRPSIEEWFTKPFVQTLATSELLGWNNVTVRSAELSPTFDYIAAPHTQDNTLVLTLEGCTRIETHVMGRFFAKRVEAGVLMTYPRGCEAIDGRWDSPAKVLFVELSQQGMADIASSVLPGDPDRIEILLHVGFYDPLLRHLTTALYRELQNESLFGPLFAECAVNMITLHLLRNYSNVSVAHQIRGGKLTPTQLRIINEYIHDHLHQKISLADLAACLHISVPHFEKKFRATLHCPPYHYVLERKIERAKLLLSGTRLSLHDVARDCGFADQSHFTRHFSRFVGISPARFMRGVR
jgi:AraC family transcriptional regulator